MRLVSDQMKEGVDIAGGGAGLTLGYGPVSIVGAGFFSHGMGGKGSRLLRWF